MGNIGLVGVLAILVGCYPVVEETIVNLSSIFRSFIFFNHLIKILAT